MKNGKKMIKWYKNIGITLLIHLVVLIFDLSYLFYGKFESHYLVPFLALLLVIIFSFIFSLVTWNSAVYIDKNKFWTKNKGKITEWKFEQIIQCRVSKRWYGRPHFFKIEITSSANPNHLVFEYSAFRERMILNLVKGTQAEKVFSDAFK